MRNDDITRRTALAMGATVPMLGLASQRAEARNRHRIVISGRTFVGNRGDGIGNAGEVALRATSSMRIEHCRFEGFGNGAILVAQPVWQLAIEDCEAVNMYRFLEDAVGDGENDASLRDFVIRRVKAEHLERGFLRIRYRSSGGLIEDVIARCKETGGARYCVGFALDDEARDITYRRCQAHGFQEVTRGSGSYWNGDGFTDERGNSAIGYIDCVATDCTDGGFDTKSTGVHMERCIARANKRNFRLWSSGTLIDCESHDPDWRGGSGGKSHFSFHGAVGRYELHRPKARAPEGNTAPVFHFSTNVPAEVVIYEADIDAPSAPLIRVEGGPEPNITFIPPRPQQRIRTAA